MCKSISFLLKLRPDRSQRRKTGPFSRDRGAQAVLVAQLHVAQLAAHETPVVLLNLLGMSKRSENINTFHY